MISTRVRRWVAVRLDQDDLDRHVRNGLYVQDALCDHSGKAYLSPAESGNGLGLWVSRSIVENHQGTIRVSSGESGHSGTTVPIFLPLRAKQVNAGEAISAAESNAG